MQRIFAYPNTQDPRPQTPREAAMASESVADIKSVVKEK